MNGFRTKTESKRLDSIARRAAEHRSLRDRKDAPELATELVEKVARENKLLPNWRIVLRLVEAILATPERKAQDERPATVQDGQQV